VGGGGWNGHQTIEYKMDGVKLLEGCAVTLMTNYSKKISMNVWTTKTSSNTGYCQPRHLAVPETTI